MEPREGLYLHEAQDLRTELTHQVCWVEQRATQQATPLTVAKGYRAVAFYREIVAHNHANDRGTNNLFRQLDLHKAYHMIPMESWIDEDEYSTSPMATPGGRRSTASQRRKAKEGLK